MRATPTANAGMAPKIPEGWPRATPFGASTFAAGEHNTAQTHVVPSTPALAKPEPEIVRYVPPIMLPIGAATELMTAASAFATKAAANRRARADVAILKRGARAGVES